MVLINCHKCNRVMVDELGDGTLRIRTRILLARLNGTGVQAVCPQCKKDVLLPFDLMPQHKREASHAWEMR
ncbi:hypothetical protein QJ48_30155 [Paenibacillus sp. A3]|uniref:hypothetical protein n=1 Tax=Paenibacillus sp. A3 TaxID=1337054 RepID=UPI0006D58615|nr:hypothetical protein [Paenibacillus sp. A3]KPV55991.1 hypothetical protein QJ48_30155 [Paenibacillus sp. A3]